MNEKGMLTDGGTRESIYHVSSVLLANFRSGYGMSGESLCQNLLSDTLCALLDFNGC